jgi:Carboxypeptidase regulatory-like domain
MSLRLNLVVFAVLTLALLPLRAQQTSATLLGTVTDESGAAAPGAVVRVSNLATNIKREATTDQAGNYSIPYLPAGAYQVNLSHQGFQAQQIDSVTLQVEQAARLDFTLKVGNVTETVNVAAQGAVLQTENASVGTVIDAGKIVDLPLNGRNFIQLAQLIPGVQAGTPGSITVRRGRGSVGQTDAAYGSTAASANGSRDTANRFFLDGIEVMDYDAMTYSFSPSVDSLAEFKVQTSTYSGEYGGAPGGQVNIQGHAVGVQPQRSVDAKLRRHREQERDLAAPESQSVRREFRRTDLGPETL